MNDSETEKELKNFMHNVAWLRKHYGISKKRMAKLLGIGVVSLNKIENGELPPRLTGEVFIKIYDLLGITPEHQLEKRLGD